MPSPARTIGGGVVLDPYPEARKRGRKKKPRAGFEHESRDERSPHFQLMAILSEAGSSGVPCALLPIRTGLTPSNVASALQAVGALTLSSHAYAARAVTDLISRIERLVSDGVANHPLEAGVSLQTIRASAEAGDEVVEWALGRLVSEHKIDRSGSRVTPAGWKPKLGEAEQVLSDGIMHEICVQPSQPPGVAELVAKFGGKTEALLRKLEREGKLERVSDDRYYSSEVVAQLIKEMRSKLETGRIYGPAELREVLGVSRKYLIPFLEFCDRRGVTERKHEGRAVRPLADSSEA